jgi:hypothetical protein
MEVMPGQSALAVRPYKVARMHGTYLVINLPTTYESTTHSTVLLNEESFIHLSTISCLKGFQGLHFAYHATS